MYLIDKPIVLNQGNDFIGSLEKAKAITRFIKNDNELLTDNNMIAIYGEWGNGKSSLMKTIAEELEDEKYQKVWIDMWKEECDYGNLSIKILNRILENIKLDESTRKGLLKKFLILGKGININIPIIPYDMKNVFEQVEKAIDPDYNLDSFIKTFQDKVKKYTKMQNKKIIVFIDDLDRCNSENMLNIIYNIKLLLSVQDVIFIIGIDKNAVSLALMNKYNNEINKAENFLDKIFPISFNMPNKPINLCLFLKANLKKLKDIQINLIEKYLLEINLVNPRKLKKLFFKYSSIKDYLIEKNVLDEKNEWDIIWVLFFIIENEFEEKNYLYMIDNKKNDLIGNKIEFDISRTTIRKKPAFNAFKISLCDTSNSRITYIPMNILGFILNPDDIYKDTIEVYGADEKVGIVVEVNLWLELYTDSISKRFAVFFYNNYSRIKEIGRGIDIIMTKTTKLLNEINKWL